MKKNKYAQPRVTLKVTLPNKSNGTEYIFSAQDVPALSFSMDSNYDPVGNLPRSAIMRDYGTTKIEIIFDNETMKMMVDSQPSPEKVASVRDEILASLSDSHTSPSRPLTDAPGGGILQRAKRALESLTEGANPDGVQSKSKKA